MRVNILLALGATVLLTGCIATALETHRDMPLVESQTWPTLVLVNEIEITVGIAKAWIGPVEFFVARDVDADRIHYAQTRSSTQFQTRYGGRATAFWRLRFARPANRTTEATRTALQQGVEFCPVPLSTWGCLSLDKVTPNPVWDVREPRGRGLRGAREKLEE